MLNSCLHGAARALPLASLQAISDAAVSVRCGLSAVAAACTEVPASAPCEGSSFALPRPGAFPLSRAPGRSPCSANNCSCRLCSNASATTAAPGSSASTSTLNGPSPCSGPCRHGLRCSCAARAATARGPSTSTNRTGALATNNALSRMRIGSSAAALAGGVECGAAVAAGARQAHGTFRSVLGSSLGRRAAFMTLAWPMGLGSSVLAARRLDSEPVPFEDEYDEDEYEDGEFVDSDLDDEELLAELEELAGQQLERELEALGRGVDMGEGEEGAGEWEDDDEDVLGEEGEEDGEGPGREMPPPPPLPRKGWRA